MAIAEAERSHQVEVVLPEAPLCQVEVGHRDAGLAVARPEALHGEVGRQAHDVVRLHGHGLPHEAGDLLGHYERDVGGNHENRVILRRLSLGERAQKRVPDVLVERLPLGDDVDRAGAGRSQQGAAVLRQRYLEPQRISDEVDLGDLGRMEQRLEDVHHHRLAGDLDERLALAPHGPAGAAVPGQQYRLYSHRDAPVPLS